MDLGKMAGGVIRSLVVGFIIILCCMWTMVTCTADWVTEGVAQSSGTAYAEQTVTPAKELAKAQTKTRPDWTSELEEAYTNLNKRWEHTGRIYWIVYDDFVTGTDRQGYTMTVPSDCSGLLVDYHYTEKIKVSKLYGGIIVSLGCREAPCKGWETFETEIDCVRFLTR
jgi:hypothetical protein